MNEISCEDIIERLLEDNHITPKEAIIMIKALLRNIKKDSSKSEPDSDGIAFKKVTPEEHKRFWKSPDIVAVYSCPISHIEDRAETSVAIGEIQHEEETNSTSIL